MRTPEQTNEEFECQKCHALVELGDGLIPTKYCNLCAQELVESMSDRLQSVEKERDRYKAALEEIAHRCEQLRAIQLIIEEADNCAMAVDGPVDKAINHMTDSDIRNIWILASGYKNPTLPPLKQPKKKHENHRT